MVKKTKIDENVAAQTDTNEQRKDELLHLLRDVLENTQANIKKTLQLLEDGEIDTDAIANSLAQARDISLGIVEPTPAGDERVIEGVFNGEQMVGPDGHEYSVPPNYASKSKLVEGDMLKLTISGNGSFIYKQIGPIEREQLVAQLVKDDRTGNWYAIKGKKKWRLLTASVTYFRGQSGDEVVILVPKGGNSNWASVENMIHTA